MGIKGSCATRMDADGREYEASFGRKPCQRRLTKRGSYWRPGFGDPRCFSAIFKASWLSSKFEPVTMSFLQPPFFARWITSSRSGA